MHSKDIFVVKHGGINFRLFRIIHPYHFPDPSQKQQQYCNQLDFSDSFRIKPISLDCDLAHNAI
ncbi:hypothetical protein GQ43DRAFT_16915 [Delitschia confertaspora ATCC 74209]|uniref:Uncharacterized protein n=1 Tax=Delitschia confertaspora ATCC 74209 TaxID=1513339 RepID=A0A9P4JMR4_9PLEO|nr:hypothetical protein GQ43DRAFT_16915 [Delitschia confertaspora ATCC 74209]